MDNERSQHDAGVTAHRIPRHGAPGQESITRIALRPLGSPLPLGFFAFGIGTFVLSGLDLGWIPTGESHTLAIVILTFAFPLEFLSGVLCYFTRDTAGGTTLCLLGASWLVLGATMLIDPPDQTSAALGLFLLSLVLCFAILAAVAILGKGVIALLLGLAIPRYLLLGIYQLSGSAPFQTASGWVGLIITAIAAYGALALLLEDAKQRTVLPLLRRGASRASFTGEVDDQFDRLKHEPGIRQQL